MARAATWIVALAALMLIATSLGSYFYHRRQLDSIAASHLRLVVSGPGELQAGIPSVYSLLATTVTGEPHPAQVEWSLSTPDGKRLVDRKETTGDQGRLTMIVPADMDLPIRSRGPAQLSITAGEGPDPPSVALPLPIRPERLLTRLWLDRRNYRAGETVYYRSLTVSRFSLAARSTLPLEFKILDPKSAPLPGSRIDGLTDHGIGNGAFRLPDSLAPGTYALVARGFEDSFPEERLEFEVMGPALPHSQAATKAEAMPARPGTLQVEFFPEGGRLAAGIENRVYFAARDAKGQPLEIRGNLVDSKGASVAPVETVRDGRGFFNITPDAAETYRLKIASPAGSSELPLLPPASSEAPIAIATERGVIAPGAPLEFNLRATKDRLPLVISIGLRGMLVGQQLLVTSSPDQRVKPKAVSIPLDDRVAGVIRLTVYDYTASPAKVLAERLVYRQPRRLVIRADIGKKPADELSLSVQNEKGRPVAAAIALTVPDGESGKSRGPGRCGPDLLHSLLSDGDLGNPAALERVDLSSSTDAATDALGLVLGCQRPTGEGKPDKAKRLSVIDKDPSNGGPALARRSGPTLRPEDSKNTPPPPVLLDNLNELRARYEATLSEYRSRRTYVVNALIMLSFFGGLALALLVTMLALLRIVWGSRLWLPTIVATVCCVVVTTVSNEPSRMKPVEATAVGFAPCMPPADVEHQEQAHPTANAGPAEADSNLRSLAEKVSKAEGDAETLKADRFVVRQYAPPDAALSKAGEDGGKLLAWYPLLLCGADGHVNVPGLTSAAGKKLRLQIEAQSDGRIESCDVIVK